MTLMDRVRQSFRTPSGYGWQLKFAMRVCLPINKGEYLAVWDELRWVLSALDGLLWAVLLIVVRFAMLALYPVSVPLVAYVNMRIARQRSGTTYESAVELWLARKREMEAQMAAERERAHD